jgi:hypothetical protein
MELIVYSILFSALFRLKWVSIFPDQLAYQYDRQQPWSSRVTSAFALVCAFLVFVNSTASVQAQTLPCNYKNLINTPANYPNAGVVTARTGGIGGILGIIGVGSVSGAANVPDATLTNSATINASTFQGSGGQISVGVNQSGGSTVIPAGAIAGYVLGSGSALGSNLQASTTIRTYLNGTLQESSSTSTLMSMPQLAGTNQIALGFTTTLNFDEVQIVIANAVSVQSSTQVFYPFIQYSTLAATATVTNASSATTADGAVAVVPSGGRAPYTYRWSNGATTQNVTGLPTGTYSVTVTDANSCTATASATIGIRVAPCPVPGQNGFTVFTVNANSLTVTTPSGSIKQGRYRNVAIINGQSVDLVGTVQSLTISGASSTNANAVDFNINGTTAEFRILDNDVRASVRWTVVQSSTATPATSIPVAFQGSFTVADLDRITATAGGVTTVTRLESIELSKANLYSYKVNPPASLSVAVIDQGTSIRFQGVANNSANNNDARYAVSLNFVGQSFFDITYNNIGIETNSYFTFDGNGSAVFDANATCVPILDTDKDGIPDANDIDDDNDGIVDDIEGLLADPDGDGLGNALDLDSDGDGIPDNIEAQTTSGFIVPSVTVTSLGLPTSYSSTNGLTPVNTDGTDNPDYLDTDSDNDLRLDVTEAGLTVSATDTDRDGLDNTNDSSPTVFGPANAGITNLLTKYPSNGTQVLWRIKEGAFTFGNCANATIIGTFVIGRSSTGTLTIPITTTRDGQVIVSVTGTGFTSVPTSVTTTLVTSQTALSIPISYDGSSPTGTRTLTVTSTQATGSCSSTVAIIGLADITTSISQPTPSLIPGQTSTLPISVSNIGSAATSGPITTTLTIPDNVATPASFTSNGFACATVGSSVTCTSSAVIAVGASTTYAVPITPGAATAGTSLTFTNFVSVTPESSQANNAGSVTVAVSSTVTARPDAGTASSGTSGTAVANVVANDIVNTLPATLGTGGNAAIAQLGTYPTGISLNTTTGSVNVAQGTAPGNYTIVYQLCDQLTPATCTTTTVAITVTPSVTANSDVGTVSAGTGGTAVPNVAANDVVNGLAATLGTGGNATLATVGTYPTGISLNMTTGAVNVVQGTAPGTYTVTYQLCDRLTTPTCATTTVTITVTPSVVATPDAGTVSAGTGGIAVANVAANDVVNGVAASPSSNATLATVGTYPTGISLNTTTGAVSVAQGTAPATYTITYQLCDRLATPTCATTTITITVTPSVVANPDAGTVSAGSGGTAVANVAANDIVNGVAATVGGNATLATVGTYPTGISLNTATGSVSVAQGTAPGTYTITYQICDRLTTPTCATTTVTITVTPRVVANPDAGTVSAGTGGTPVANVAANDVVNGVAATVGGNATLTTIGTYPPSITLNTTTGAVSVAQGTAPGTYTVVYQLCDRLTTPTCATTTVTITVTPSVVANPDAGTVIAGTGGTPVANVAANDIVNGVAATLGANGNATLTTVGTYPSGITLNTTTGSVSVAQGTTPATYTITYQLCDRLTTPTCATTTVTITVTPSVVASPDAGTVSAGTGGTPIANVATNDVVNGVAATLGTGGNAVLTAIGTYPTGITLNTGTGAVSVAQGTTPGTYTLVYQICDRLTTPTCATTTVTITVTPSVVANPDAGTVSAGTGGTAVANVATNDVVNGVAATMGGNATLATVGTYPTGITLNTTTGSVSVAQGTPPATYTLVYQLCDRLTTPTCATTTITITVTPIVIANPDAGTVSAGTGGTPVANVAANDVVNGVAVTLGTGGNATLATVGTYPTGIALNTTTGAVSVAQGTAPSTYTLVYQICDRLTTPTCATTTVTITVTPNVIANPDAGTVSAGTGGTVVANVATNDVVNGVAATLGTGGNATLATVGTYPTGITLNTGTGTVSVAQGTAPGTYTVVYQLCDRLTPTTCSTATVTITITPSVIAVPDAGSVSSGTGGTAVANVAANDVVNGLPATLGASGNATLATSGTYAAGITLNTTTGSVNVALSTTPGTYTVAYQICDKLTSTCSTTTVSITVVPSSNPTPDSGTVCSGVAINNVAANDVVNGQPAVLGTNATITSSGTYPTGITLNTTTGAINVATTTAAGSYTLIYQLCSTIGTPACATSTATVTVNQAVTATLSSASICNGTSATLTATGGNSYRFGPGNTNTSGLLIVAPTVIGVTPYSVTVTSGLGCSAVAMGTVTVNALPQPTISGSTSLCAGQSISLLANPTTGLTYAWSGPGGNLGSSNPLIIPNSTTANSGTYQVRVTDVNGCTALASQNVTVKPTPLAQILNTSIVCAGNMPAVAIATQVTGGSPPVSYAWYRSGAAGVISTAPNPTFSIADTYSLVVTDASGCQSNTATVVVMTPNPLAVNTQTSNARCFGGQGTITVTTNGGTTPYTISYYNSSGLISSTQTTGVSILTTVAGSYSIVVTDANGCSLTQTAAITQPPLLAVSLTGGGPVCAGQATGTITSSASGGTPSYVYSWSTTTGPLAQTTPTLTGLGGGSYSVVVTDANGCTATSSITLPTNPLPSAPTVSVTQPTCITLTGTIQVLTPASGVQYSFNNGISYQSSASLAGLQPDVYRLKVKDISTGCESPVTSVTINPVPSPPVVSITGSTTYCAGQPISLTANPTSNVSYVWSGPGGDLGTANPLVIQNPTPAQSGTYRVQVTDVNGCTAVANTTVTVYPLPIATLAVNSLSTCYGQPISLTAGGGTSYAFSPNVSGVTGNVASFTAGLGTALYSVTATSAQGCISLPTTVTVTVSSCVSPVPDSGTVSAGTGGLAVVSVVTNDQVNLSPATLGTGGNATLAVIGTYPNGISLNTTTGAVSVAQGTAPGIYTLVYQLCDRLATPTCATTTVTITVTPSVVANADAGTVSAGTGGTAVANIATNDVVNGVAATLGAGGNAVVTTVGTYPTGITLDTSTGSVSVAIGTAPGTYTITYQLCDRLDIPTCATTTVIITVTPSVTANPDAGTVSAGTGGTAVANVAANDVVNGLAATVGAGGNATLTAVGTYPTGINLDTATGSVSVAQGTAPDTYTITYQICDRLTPATCATTTVTITVTPSVVANPDAGTVSAGTGGTAVANVATNDVVNGVAATLGTGGNATITTIGTYPAGITLDITTGSVSVAQGTAPGSYTINYQICDQLATPTCATTTVSIIVTPSIIATPDTGTVSAGTGGTAVANVVDNDVVNGVPATLGAGGNATVTAVGTYPAGITLDTTTGSISVAIGTVPDTYTIAYQLCDQLTTPTCATTTITITITPSVTANPDAGTVSAGSGGTAVVNVADNDVINGIPATLGAGGNATVTAVGTYPIGITLDTTTGSVSVAQGTAPGAYTITYQICDQLTTPTCATTTITVTVTPSVIAIPDAGTVSAGLGGTAVVNVADNDVINGIPATLGAGGNATLAVVGTYPTGISLNTSTGEVIVAQGTTPDSYTISYQICDQLAIPTCAITTVTITVTPSVTAGPDAGTISAGTGGTAVANVTANDVVNGIPATLGIGGNAILTAVDTYPDGITLDTETGSVSVAVGTAPGTYTITYQLCDQLSTPTCATAIVTITVTPSVTALPDSGTVGSGSGGTAVINVVTNDVVNGIPATLGAGGNAILTAIDTYPTGITLNTATGSIDVAVGTAQGSYTVTYQICDLLSPPTCATATATITITALSPITLADVATTRPNTPVSGNVLTNDRDPQGLPLTTTLLGTPTNGTVTFNPDGSYTFTPTADFTGVASFCYSASTSAGLSSSACVSINIEADPTGGNAKPIATNDNIRGYQNQTVTVFVLANDADPNSATSLNGQLTIPTLIAQPDQGVAIINSNGSITYTPPIAFTGVVSFDYQICDRATPALCATATVTVNVLTTPPTGTTLAPVSVDDFVLTPINALVAGTVSGNDYDPQGLALSYTVGQPSSGTVVMSPTGSYTYTPAAGFTGPSSFTYQVCNTAGLCDVATVSVLIQPLPPTVKLSPQVYLQGALFGVTTGSLMRDDLRAAGYLPVNHPYAALNPITPVGTLTPSVTAVTGNDAIVDWVFVELRSEIDSRVIVDSRAALLQRDGDIVEVDGVSSLSFTQPTLGEYYVVVRHRNHLGVMSQSALPLSATALTVDFRNINTPTYTNSGTTSYTQVTRDQAQVIVQVQQQQRVAMWAGNVLIDNAANPPHNLVIYQGPNNDINQIYQLIIGAPANILTLPSYRLRGYQSGDVNMDGQTIFQGTNNDVEFIYQNVIKNHPGNALRVPFFIIREQVP